MWKAIYSLYYNYIIHTQHIKTNKLTNKTLKIKTRILRTVSPRASHIVHGAFISPENPGESWESTWNR